MLRFKPPAASPAEPKPALLIGERVYLPTHGGIPRALRGASMEVIDIEDDRVQLDILWSAYPDGLGSFLRPAEEDQVEQYLDN